MPVAPPPANTPTVDAFAQKVTALAQQYRITLLAIVAVDPKTREQKLYASPGAIDATRELVAAKYAVQMGDDIDESVTSWNDT